MSQARKDLDSYAKRFDLQVFEGHDECATQMDVDAEDLREMVGEMEAIACYPDHTVFQVCAFIANGKLHRFGLEHQGEDPGDVVPTTLKKLLSLSDPHSW
jgi:hypothetical protein